MAVTCTEYLTNVKWVSRYGFEFLFFFFPSTKVSISFDRGWEFGFKSKLVLFAMFPLWSLVIWKLPWKLRVPFGINYANWFNFFFKIKILTWKKSYKYFWLEINFGIKLKVVTKSSHKFCFNQKYKFATFFLKKKLWTWKKSYKYFW
jgi:hypothetical protein